MQCALTFGRTTQRKGERGRGDDGEAVATVRQARDAVRGAHFGDRAGGARSSASARTEGGGRREWRGRDQLRASWSS
jgi:hypothetical protein